MIAAVLDSCVLWPSLMRDFLLSMAIENIYRPLWSERILEELGYNEESRLIDQMRNAFDDSCVAGWEPLGGNFGLPDPDDEHLVAAAHMAGAGAIVTSNVRDFPATSCPRASTSRNQLRLLPMPWTLIQSQPQERLRLLPDDPGDAGRR